LEEEIEYISDEAARIKLFGKWHNLPRKNAGYGDKGDLSNIDIDKATFIIRR
jgi:hypothetical protein